jgi:hypothetical protein
MHFSFKFVQKFFQSKNLEYQKIPTKPTKNNNYKKFNSL